MTPLFSRWKQLVLAISVCCFINSNLRLTYCNESSCDDIGCKLQEIQDLQKQQPANLFTCEPVYYGEVFTNARGGKATREATQYLGLLNLDIRLDLNSSHTSIPGQLYFLLQNAHGRGLTEDFIGDTQVISNIDSFRNGMWIGEYWWEKSWLDDLITLRLGKQDLNTEFQRIDSAEHFVQSTFGLSPSTAFPTYPDQAAGAVLLIKLSDNLLGKFGVWNAFVRNRNWGFTNNNSFLIISELEYQYTLTEGKLPGIIAWGALYESEGNLDNEFVPAVREYYIQMEQSLYRDGSDNRKLPRDLKVFGGYYPRFPGNQPIADSIGDSAVAGITYTGLLPGRELDILGVGMAWSELFRGGTNQETAIEIFYRAIWSTRLSLQPDIQYISSPSGIYRDAIAAGIRMELRL